MATCEALSLFALNAASHRSLQAADTFQTTLSLLGSSPECHVSVEVEAMVRAFCTPSCSSLCNTKAIIPMVSALQSSEGP